MITWEYHTEAAGDARMNELGAQGWEAWGIDADGQTRFKRPILTPVGYSLRSPVMMAGQLPPAQWEHCLAFPDSNGVPQWVTSTNALPTSA